MGKMNSDALKVAVLMGGIGGEREVSLQSGSSVAKALTAAGCNVTAADITPTNLSALDLPVDVFFIVLHGRFGEDGDLQQIMEDRGLVYTGCGPSASRLGMDKVKSKRLFAAAGVHVAPAVEYHPAVRPCEVEAIAAAGTKLVVKPVTGGSTVGVTVVSDPTAALVDAARCLREQGDCMIECFIPGREITVGILHGKALPIIEIRTRAGFYDYNAKYIDDSTEYLFDTIADAGMVSRISDAAVACFNAIGCRDYARMDFILTDDGPVALEINTIPGFTSHSLLPKAAARVGIPMPQLCMDIVTTALKRNNA